MKTKSVVERNIQNKEQLYKNSGSHINRKRIQTTWIRIFIISIVMFEAIRS